MKMHRTFFQTFAIVGFAVSAANLAQAQAAVTPDRTYLVGLARYIVQRGHVTIGVAETSDTAVDIYYRPKRVESADLGKTILCEVVIPQWKIELELRKADYSSPETGGKYHNKTFALSAFSPVVEPVALGGWASIRVTNDEMLKAGIESFTRPLNAAQQAAVLKTALGKLADGRSQSGFRFSKLYGFENVIWLFDLQTSTLYRVESDGDLDDVEAMKGFGPRTREYRLTRHDLSRAFLSGKPWSSNDSIAYGLFLCFATDADEAGRGLVQR